VWLWRSLRLPWAPSDATPTRAPGLAPRTAAAATEVLCATSCGLLFGKDTQAAWQADDTVYFHNGFSPGPTLLTKEDGKVFEERRYEPFGVDIDAYRELQGSQTQIGPINFAADPTNILNKASDPVTKWSYHGARWMAPQTGRWHSPDPIAKVPDPGFMTEPCALHPYQYVEQNPVIYWDPDGRDQRLLHSTGGGPSSLLGGGSRIVRETNLVRIEGGLQAAGGAVLGLGAKLFAFTTGRIVG